MLKRKYRAAFRNGQSCCHCVQHSCSPELQVHCLKSYKSGRLHPLRHDLINHLLKYNLKYPLHYPLNHPKNDQSF